MYKTYYEVNARDCQGSWVFSSGYTDRDEAEDFAEKMNECSSNATYWVTSYRVRA